MNISRISFTPNFSGKTINIPYSRQAKHFHISDDDNLEQDTFVSSNKSKTGFFRDDELYDPEIDSVSCGYKSYSYDDVPLFRQPKNLMDIDYRNEYKSDRISDSILDTDIDPTYYQINREISISDDEFDEFFLDYDNLKIFNDLKRTRANSETELTAVCKASSLKNNSNKANINLSMVRKGLSVLNSPAEEKDILDVVKILKSSVLRDSEGNEYFSPKLFNFAKDFPKHYNIVITVNKNKSEVFDSVSAREFLKLYNLYRDDNIAADIVNACKLSDSDGNKILNSDLLYVLSHLQNMKDVSSSQIPDIINSLKSVRKNKVEERVSLQKLRYVINSTNKTGKQLLSKLQKR